MPPSTVLMMTESVLVLSTLIPEAFAKVGLEPTAVIAVPVFVCKNAHIRNAKKAKNNNAPVGISKLPIFIFKKSERIWR